MTGVMIRPSMCQYMSSSASSFQAHAGKMTVKMHVKSAFREGGMATVFSNCILWILLFEAFAHPSDDHRYYMKGSPRRLIELPERKCPPGQMRNQEGDCSPVPIPQRSPPIGDSLGKPLLTT
ncbi:hypothetical protein AAG570_005658 [Ranatra chinensis]|uniref:Uncharacterized protein n=1 Tax=Ranatra chinensis TaxID=642074 RepID=A0ABD0YAW0_9HEMI